MCNLIKNKLKILKNKKIYLDEFTINENIENIVKNYKYFSNLELQKIKKIFYIAGRIILKRKIGKVIFINISDIYSSIQLYLPFNLINKNNLDKLIDIGDIIGIHGKLFRTKVNELSLYCINFYLLNKSFVKLPNKFNGLKNIEYRSKKRYLDLISNKKSRETFILRSKIINIIRNYLINKNFLEVETPIMQNLPGGAIAKPFITKYNYFSKNFYLRISPELYLKRLIISGFNNIFEIGKSFRNEGISNIHNPEFTILELYSTYTNYLYLINLIQDMISFICINIFNKNEFKFNDKLISLNKKFDIISMDNSIIKFNNLKKIDLNIIENCIYLSKKLNVNIYNFNEIGRIKYEIFKKTVENKLIQPTFILEYPVSVSPLAKRNSYNNNITDRFELFICGLEICNGFSELNDYEDQSYRFKNQLEYNENNYFYDYDYIESMKCGFPPTSGLGIGIDRLIMLLTNNINIKDVILFPTVRYK